MFFITNVFRKYFASWAQNFDPTQNLLAGNNALTTGIPLLEIEKQKIFFKDLLHAQSQKGNFLRKTCPGLHCQTHKKVPSKQISTSVKNSFLNFQQQKGTLIF